MYNHSQYIEIVVNHVGEGEVIVERKWEINSEKYVTCSVSEMIQTWNIYSIDVLMCVSDGMEFKV